MLTVGSLAAALAEMPQDAHVVIEGGPCVGEEGSWALAVTAVLRETVLPTRYGEGVTPGGLPGYFREAHVGDWIKDDKNAVLAIVLEGPRDD